MLVVPRAIADMIQVDGEMQVMDLGGKQGVALRIQLDGRAQDATCPSCGQRSARVHSRYVRTLADLALQGTPVRLAVRVRRFRCNVQTCPRSTFVEPLAALAAPRARRTHRLAAMQIAVGMALGASAGARLLPRLGAATSASSVLRLMGLSVGQTFPTPRVLGVDDWAFKRGHHYGTVLVDLERRRVIDLLPDREADTLAAWLRDHPGVEIVSRDRAEAYAEGARRGAPEAVQIVDRWHLLKNVGDALERVLHHHRAALTDATEAALASSASAPVSAASTVVPAAKQPAVLDAVAASRQAAQAARQTLYDRIHVLRAMGASLHAISSETGASRPTVRKYLAAQTCPTRSPRRGKIVTLSTFDMHLRTRWSAGCHDAKALHSELLALGFHGSIRTVQRHVARWSVSQRTPRRSRVATSAGTAMRLKSPSPKLARWWLVLPSTRLSVDQRRVVDYLTEHIPAVRAARDLAVDFAQVLRDRDVAGLTTWLDRATASAHAEFRDLAASLRRDLAPVEAAVCGPWSNGQTEGQVTKLKMLKRQMYGRASIALLRKRLLYAA